MTQAFRTIGSFADDVVERLSLGAVERHAVTDRESWLKMRAQDVTASDVASICGVGYRSPMAVWAEKLGHIPPTADNPLLRRGRWLEPSIWTALKDERPAWEIRAAKTYLRSPSLKIGATPDALAIDPDRAGIMLVQGKVVAKPAFIANWLGGERDGVTPEVPLGYQLQTLTETMLAEAAFQTEVHPVVAALVLDTYTADLHLIPVRRHVEAEQRILSSVKSFWDMIAAGLQPAVDPTRDSDVVAQLYPTDNGTTIDLSGENDLPALVDERKRLGEVVSEAEERRKEISTEIMAKIGAHSFAVIAGGRRLSAKVTNVKEQLRKAYAFRALREVKGL